MAGLLRFVQMALPITSTRGRLVRRAQRPTIGRVLADYAATHPDVYLVQIGSHNGQTGDPLCSLIDEHPGWCGVMVEPTPERFAELSEHRGDARFRLVRAAVTTFDGSVVMTTVDVADDHPWYADQLSTLDEHQRQVLESDPVLAGHLREIEVPAMTFATLTKDVERIDVLHIDTEGHDAVILGQVDLDRWRPDVVLYEHGSLAPADLQACEQRLRSAGYTLLTERQDTLAVRNWEWWRKPRRD